MKIYYKIVYVVLMFNFPNLLMAQLETGTFNYEGYVRDYLVILPQNFQSNMPVVIDIHGYGGDAYWEMDYTLMHNIGDTAGFITVYPNAIDEKWNSGIAGNPDYPTPNVDDVGYFAILIDSLIAHYNIDPLRIYVCGLSNGGFMTSRLACELGYRFAAAGAVAGTISNTTAKNCSSIQPLPIIYIHGTEDKVVPYLGDIGWYSVEQTLQHWINKNNCSGEPDTLSLIDLDTTDNSTVDKITFNNCTDSSQVILYKVIGGSHNWPGADFTIYPPQNNDINAGAEIWNFVKKFTLTPMAYTKNITVDPVYAIPGKDTLMIKGQVENPNNHNLSVIATIFDQDSNRIDSTYLYSDGDNQGIATTNGIWEGYWPVPIGEEWYSINMKTYSLDFDEYTMTYRAPDFVTIGPLIVYDFDIISSDTIPNHGDRIGYKLTLRNDGQTATVTNVTTNLRSLGSCATITGIPDKAYGDIAPGATAVHSGGHTVIFSDTIAGCSNPMTTQILVEISSDGSVFWYDTLEIEVIVDDIDKKELSIPKRYAILQNYPNPFNPKTMINYQLPMTSDVELSIYNLLGQKVATLVNERQKAGDHQVEWDASGFASGIYYYRIEAGEFQDVMKMILIK